jgi:hypothetical protein
LRQSAQKIDNSLTWKQEVERRVAEHKERKTGSTNESHAGAEIQPAAGSRAAAAVARVAARYAKAPSYGEMLAEEARAAVRAAEAASRAALDAQAAAEQVLAGLEAASSATRSWDPEFFAPPAPELVVEPARKPAAAPAPAVAPPVAAAPVVQSLRGPASRASYDIRWDEDMPIRESEPAAGRTTHSREPIQAAPGSTWQPSQDARGPLHTEGFEIVEAAQPIHANLIEFPRELVATRKVRPRRAEGGYAAAIEEQGQLSIFEVDPGSVSTEPGAAAMRAEESAAAWEGPKWSGITLDEEPRPELDREHRTEWVDRQEAAQPVGELELAPLNLRLMGALVDLSLVAGGFLAVAATEVLRAKVLPPMRSIELDSAMGLALIGIVYLAGFLVLGKATPGMKYARLELRTFTGEPPTMAQRARRMGALTMSLLPVGLGAGLALFDEQRLCWHDRLSGTYTRKI